MKKNRFRTFLRTFTVILSLILAAVTFSSCGVVPVFMYYSAVYDTVFTGFDNLEYERPDFDGIRSDIEALINKLNNGSNSPFLSYEYTKIILSVNSAADMRTYAEILSNLDISDSELMEEYNYCNDGLNSILADVNRLYSAIIDNGYSDELLSGWTEEDYESYEISKMLYDEEYTELDSQLQDILAEYSTDLSEITMSYGGEQLTINEIAVKYQNGEITYAEYRDCVVDYYRTMSEISADKLIGTVEINNAIADKLGYESYADYAYEVVFSRDYAPDDVKTIYEYVKEYIVPAKENIDAVLNLPENLISLNDALINAAYTLDDYDDAIDRFTSEISETMNVAYNNMKLYGLINMGNSANRQQISYTTMFYTYGNGIPFMFITTSGSLNDITTFSHEFGHFYAFMRNELESDNVLDVNEMQSQISELLFIEYYDLPDDQKHLLELSIVSQKLDSILSGCLQDEFLQTVYSLEDTENIGSDELNEIYGELAVEYGMDDVYPGYSQYLWSAIYHDFAVPFYYISYAMSAIPSLEVYSIALDDRQDAIDIYNDVCNMTGYRDFLEVLDNNRLASPFQIQTYMNIDNLVDRLISDGDTSSVPSEDGGTSIYQTEQYSLYAAA